jgi:hypothetical protein
MAPPFAAAPAPSTIIPNAISAFSQGWHLSPHYCCASKHQYSQYNALCVVDGGGLSLAYSPRNQSDTRE